MILFTGEVGGGSGPGGGGFIQIFFWGGSSKFSGGVPQIFGGGLHRNMVNVRPVCILLECILVIK